MFIHIIVKETISMHYEMSLANVKSSTYSEIVHSIASIMHQHLGIQGIRAIHRGIFDHQRTMETLLLEMHKVGMQQLILELHHLICGILETLRQISIKLFAMMLALYSIRISNPQGFMIRFVFKL